MNTSPLTKIESGFYSHDSIRATNRKTNYIVGSLTLLFLSKKIFASSFVNFPRCGSSSSDFPVSLCWHFSIVMKKKLAFILITHSQFFLSFSAEYLCRWTFLLQFNKDLEIFGRSRASLLRKLTFLFIFSFVLKFSGSIFIKRVRQMTRCVFVFGTKGRYDRLPLA